MTDLNDLDCKIYVEAQRTRDELVALLRPVLAGGQISRGPGGTTVQTPYGEVEVRRNEDADPLRAGEFPDGFLYFAYALELYSPPTRQEDRVAFVTRLVEHLWSQGLPAVAVCDYENELPNGGGFNNPSVPWPVTATNSRAVEQLNGGSSLDRPMAGQSGDKGERS